MLKKKKNEARSRWYPTKVMTDADYADLVLLTNTSAQDKSLLEQATGSISLYLNVNKVHFMCFKHGTISTNSPLKLV